MIDETMVGYRGCSQKIKRRFGVERRCAQEAIVTRNGKPYCYYHDPENPKKFGEGYNSEEIKRRKESTNV